MSKVSRSVYQKVKEENKRLLSDIEILVGPVNMDRINMYKKWQKHFRDKKELHEMIKSVATEMVLKDPDKYPKFLVDKAKQNQAEKR